ncbi:AAA family ATPase [Arthrobacter crystallopoietes]|uniref:AAA family ATPase n=1 Tax=Crystallibacter crystallopoietes TaxID=37928 RepID=UPI001ABEE590|nr:AAA family ATPase [Arthrobacter crystallopoietes]QTG80044.1 AAA family ATPase [Arthrobacter crystallopoietes]
MLELYLLGEQRLVIDVSSSSSVPVSRPVELLAYLALHAGTQVPRQVLAGLFWPDSTSSQALTNLRRELHNLKGIIGDAGCLGSRGGTLSWQDTAGCWTDVQVFKAETNAARLAWQAANYPAFLGHAQQAQDQYRGTLMPGCYADWILEPREELKQQCVLLYDQSVEACNELKEPRRAAVLAEQRIRLEPLEERGYRQLMEVQAQLGDRAAAMHTFHRCEALLEQELGVGPDPVTQRLFDRVLNSRGLLRAAGVGTASSRPVRSPLVGRHRELRILDSSWQGAAAGKVGLLLISGDPGVGKTRMSEELAALARTSGGLVAQTRCFSTPGRIPLAPVAAWLRNDAFRSSLMAMPAYWRAEVARLLPDRTMPASAPIKGEEQAGSRAMVDAWQRHRFFEGLARAVTGTGRPVLLVLDDLQWSDAETCSWLSYLLGSAGQSGLLVAATLRFSAAAGEPQVRAFLQGLRAAGLVTELPLEPLSAAASGLLASTFSERRLPAEEAALVHAATGGYPLYIIEAARILPESHRTEGEGAATELSSILWQRLSQSSATAREIAGLTAAFGRDITLDLLGEACDQDDATLVDAVDELWRMRILGPRAGGYDFTHDLLRAVAYEHVTPARRWLLHRRLAQGLELLYSDRLDVVAPQLAEQYSLGSRPDKALQFFRRAADAASGVFANAEALKFFRRCLDLISKLPAGKDRDERELDVLRSMSPPETALYGYSSGQLLATLERTAELAQQLHHPQVLLAGLIGLFAARFVQGGTAESYRIGHRALGMAAADPDLLGQAHFAVAGAALSLGRPREAMEHFAHCYENDPGGYSFILGTKLEVHAMGWASHAHWLAGEENEAAELCRKALARARSLEHPYTLTVALSYVAVFHQLLGDKTSMAPLVAELQEICHRYDFAYYGQWARILQGWVRGGASGTAQIRAGIRALQNQDAFARMPYWLSLLAGNLADAGDGQTARSVLDAALAAGQQRDDMWWLPEVLRQRAKLSGTAEAREMLQRARELATAQGSSALLGRLDA